MRQSEARRRRRRAARQHRDGFEAGWARWGRSLSEGRHRAVIRAALGRRDPEIWRIEGGFAWKCPCGARCSISFATFEEALADFDNQERPLLLAAEHQVDAESRFSGRPLARQAWNRLSHCGQRLDGPCRRCGITATQEEAEELQALLRSYPSRAEDDLFPRGRVDPDGMTLYALPLRSQSH